MTAPARGPRLQSLSGRQKSAILCLALGPEQGARLLQALEPDEQEAVGREIATLPPVDAEVVRGVLEEFRKAAQSAPAGVRGSDGAARRMLEQALGPARARPVLERIEGARPETQLRALKQATPLQIAGVLRDEHPQTVALVLSHLDVTSACGVLDALEAPVAADVLYRMARLGEVRAEDLQVVEKALAGKADLSFQPRAAASAGPATVARMLNQTGGDRERQLLDLMGEHSPDVAARVKALMFTFEDLLLVDGRGMQRLLREVETRELALALKAASEELRRHIRANMSERAGAALEEEVEMLGPVRVKEVEAAQARIIESVRALEESGEILIRGRGGQDDVIA